jgi:hypothetical protein
MYLNVILRKFTHEVLSPRGFLYLIFNTLYYEKKLFF